MTMDDETTTAALDQAREMARLRRDLAAAHRIIAGVVDALAAHDRDVADLPRIAASFAEAVTRGAMAAEAAKISASWGGAAVTVTADPPAAASEPRAFAVGQRVQVLYDYSGPLCGVVREARADGGSPPYIVDLDAAGDVVQTAEAAPMLTEVTHEGVRYAVGDRWRFDDGTPATVAAVYPPEPARGWFEPRLSLDGRSPSHVGWWIGQGWEPSAPVEAAPPQRLAVGDRVRLTRLVGPWAAGVAGAVRRVSSTTENPYGVALDCASAMHWFRADEIEPVTP